MVGAGPAGLACAHRLALHGHDVVIFDAREKPGGLNEYGIAAYKTVDDFAQREVDFILAIGGIRIETGKALGRDFSLADLRQDFDAVFLGMGLAGVNALGAEGEAAAGALDAVDWIAELRQARDMAELPIGRRVVVIGGGMTAVDAAVQSKLLGAEEVTIVYRRGQAEMKASVWEQDLAKTRGVRVLHWARPLRLIADASGNVHAIALERTQLDESGRLAATGEIVTLPADMVFKAIGQTFVAGPLDGAGGGHPARRRAHRRRRGAPHVDARRMGGRRLRRWRRGSDGRRGAGRQAGGGEYQPRADGVMKNIQIIDGADNCAYDIFAATDAEFERIFREPGQDIEFIEDLAGRDDWAELEAAFERIWARPVDKKSAVGIHATIFYQLYSKREYYPNKREADLTAGLGRAQPR